MVKSANHITAEQSDVLNQVDRGTPMGDLLRQYWWPVGIAQDVKDRPTFVKLLGEELVLFRDGNGEIGLVGAKCPHRRANLCWGTTAEAGVRCRYHGWVIDREGSVVDVPGEPDASFKQQIHHLAYPTEVAAGLVFAYLGPKPTQPFPRYNFLKNTGRHFAKLTGYAETNWMGTIENGMDPIHLNFVHPASFTDLGGLPDVWFEAHDWGVAYVSVRPLDDDQYGVRVHNFLLPAISQTGNTDRWVEGSAGSGDPPISARWAVPADETHTVMFRILWIPEGHDGGLRNASWAERWDSEWIAERAEPFKEYREANFSGNVELGYDYPLGASREDATIVESIGPAIDHENENLAPRGDEGLGVLRQMYLQAMSDLQNGRPLKGTVRAPEHAVCIKPGTGERVVDQQEYDRLRLHRNVSASLADAV